MHRLVVKCGVLAAFIFGSSISPAQEVAPDVLLKAVTAEVIALMKVRRGHLNIHRTNEVNELIERKILPLFNFRRMTRSAVGTNWRVATPDQRNAVTTEFKTLLVRTYTTALRHFRNHVIEFEPLNMEQEAIEATVRSVVREGDAARMTIDYEMEKTAAGWKIYEVRIDGVNLTQNYRSTFAARVRDVGLDGLIRLLSDKNRQSSYSGSGPYRAAAESPG